MLLLSKNAMKKIKTHIDFQKDKITLPGQKIDIKFTSKGSCCVYPPNLVMKINSNQTFLSLGITNII